MGIYAMKHLFHKDTKADASQKCIEDIPLDGYSKGQKSLFQNSMYCWAWIQNNAGDVMWSVECKVK